MNSPKNKPITINVTTNWCAAIAAQLRRVTPQNHETDEWIASNVHWLEQIADDNG